MEQKSKVINGTNYLVTQIDAIRALKMQAKLIKLLGPAIKELKGAKLSKEEAKTKAKDAILSLAENFDDENIVDLVLLLFDKNVFYEKDEVAVKVNFSTHFVGKITEMWQVVLFILEVNFGDLLGKFKSNSVIKEGLEAVKKEL